MKDPMEMAATVVNALSLDGKRTDALARHAIPVRKLLITKATPIEKDVKDRVKKIVGMLAPEAHIFMPVQTGFGSPDLDFVISVNGFALRIETKVDHKQPTPRQMQTIAALDRAGVPVVVVDQSNLIDVAISVDFLLRGMQGDAIQFARSQREDYTQ